MSTGTQVEVVMPQMGVSVSEGTITRWLKQAGETVTLDEPLLEISTDKVDTEVPSPGEGVVAEIRVQEGETVEVGTVLAVIGPTAALPADAESASEAPAPEATEAPAPTEPVAPTLTAATSPAPTEAPAPALTNAPAPAPPSAAGAAAPPSDTVSQAPSEPAAPPESGPEAPGQEVPAVHEPLEAGPAPPEGSEAPAQQVPDVQAPAPSVPAGNGRTFISPVVARIAAEHGVDPGAVAGTGQGGRVTKKDILGFIESGAAPAPVAPPSEVPLETPVESPAAPSAPETPAAVPPSPPTAPAPKAPVAGVPEAPAQQVPTAAGEHEEPMNAMRRGIAEHMRRSLDTSAHVTSAIEVDMSQIVAARQKLKQEYQSAYGVNPTYLAFVTKAAIETLADWPWVNGELRGEKIVTRPWVNVGIAVALEDGKGLIVPVIRNAQDLNLLGIARAIADVAERARTKKLLPDDVQGGTFTITNPGGYGTFHGTPVISQPQAAILGTYALVKRPWVVQDALGQDVIAIRPLMNITLTYDHRLVDGAYSGGFLRDLRARLEVWDEES